MARSGLVWHEVEDRVLKLKVLKLQNETKLAANFQSSDLSALKKTTIRAKNTIRSRIVFLLTNESPISASSHDNYRYCFVIICLSLTKEHINKTD